MSLSKGPGQKTWEALTATLLRNQRQTTAEVDRLKDLLYNPLATQTDLLEYTSALKRQFEEPDGRNPNRLNNAKSDVRKEVSLTQIDRAEFEGHYGPKPLQDHPEYAEAMTCLARRAIHRQRKI